MDSPRKPPSPSVPATPTASTSQKRKSSCQENQTSARRVPRRISRFGQADSDTPCKYSSARRTESSAGGSRASKYAAPNVTTTRATYSRTDEPQVAAARRALQSDMEGYLDDEMAGAMFCDFDFVSNFLTVDATEQQRIFERCEAGLEVFEYPQRVSQEPELYDPLCRLLNIIKHAVDGENGQGEFVDANSKLIQSHYSDMANLKPDIVLFDGSARHWETVRMAIEVKKDQKDVKKGMRQLTQYARAMFAHQLHRRFVYGLVVCGSRATFVRFDRSGILYSQPMDVRTERERFCKAFAGLMMMDEEDFGFDTAFTTRARRDGLLEYYVNLPAGAFPVEDTETANPAPDVATAVAEPSNAPPAPQAPATRKLKVVEVLCHRKTIRGRSTKVMRVQEVLQDGVSELPEQRQGMRTRSRTNPEPQQMERLSTRVYVLKLMWRDPNKKAEGEVLSRLVGVYGVGRYVWHGDVFVSCSSAGCVNGSRGDCLDRTPDRNRVHTAVGMTDLSLGEMVKVEETEDAANENDKELEYSEAYAQRTSRTYCRLLMSTVGEKLSSARSARELVNALLDAILGYWRVVNKGLLHRDISDGNVLLLRDRTGYSQCEWKDPASVPEGLDANLLESETLLQETIERLDRDPTAILNDFDISATHNLMRALFFGEPLPAQSDDLDTQLEAPEHSDEDGQAEPGSKRRKLNSSMPAEQKMRPRVDFRTGTPAFMSARVLEVPIGERYHHSFMDDLESFLWVLLWCVAEHLDPGTKSATVGAIKILNALDQEDFDNIAGRKKAYMACCSISDGSDMRGYLMACGNKWADNTMIFHLITKLGAYFHPINRRKIQKYKPAQVFPEIVNMFTNALQRPEHSLADMALDDDDNEYDDA